MALTAPTVIFVCSLCGIPVAYIVNTFPILNSETGLFFSGVIVLIGMCVITYFGAKQKDKKPVDPFLYVLTLGCFSSVVDLFIGLENDGIYHGIMSSYLVKGEPYLQSVHGTLICYWDGIGHYALYLLILVAMARNQNFRETALYWVGSFGHSLFVFIPGSILGKYSLNWSFLLNVPYVIIPFACARKFLSTRPLETLSQNEARRVHKSLFRRPLDILFILSLVASIAIAFFRGFAVINGSKYQMLDWYIKHVEPYLEDPGLYSKFQMLTYLYYFVPYYIAAIYGLTFSGQSWMSDWSLIHAGAAVQAQISHIGSSLHIRTPYIMRVPSTTSAQTIFWAINGFLLVFPQLFALRCVLSRHFFSPVSHSKRD